jgi:co-chaperonin GroES (HSP10)
MALTITNLKPIRNNIVFQFVEQTSGGRFLARKTEAGIILGSILDEQSIPRWGKVISVGPDVAEEEASIVPGIFIFIEGGAWTQQITLDDGEKIWKTDVSKVIATSDEEPNL